MKSNLKGLDDQLVRSVFVIGFDGYELPKQTADLLAGGLAGVTLFARNISDRVQLMELCASIREAALPSGLVPIIAVDQEGGRVQRLRRIGPLFDAARDQANPRDTGLHIGDELALLGFNTDYAPVLDVDSNPSNPIIGDRSFSCDPVVVASSAVAFHEGLAGAGIVGCGKHFPGHGDASADSHLDLPRIQISRETLATRELIPFKAAVGAGFRMMMTAHCLYPSIDPSLPATLSSHFIKPILRDSLGFDGVVISDDLGMKAIADRFGPDDVVRLGIGAGLDIFLHCGIEGEATQLMDSLFNQVDSGVIPVADVAAAAGRIRWLRSRFLR